MPEEYDFEYMVYSACDSVLDKEKILWETPLIDVVMWSMFKKFDSYTEDRYVEAKMRDK